MWTQTLVSAQAANASGPVVQQIESTLAAIEAIQQVLQPQHDAILDLESRISAQKVRCDNTIAEIAEAQRKAVSGIMTRGLPIWSPDLWAPTRATLLARAGEIATDRWADISQYVRDPTKGMPFHVGLFVVLVALFNAARRQVRRWAMEGRDLPPSANVFDRPYACRAACPHGNCRLSSLFTGASNCSGAVPGLVARARAPARAAGG